MVLPIENWYVDGLKYCAKVTLFGMGATAVNSPYKEMRETQFSWTGQCKWCYGISSSPAAYFFLFNSSTYRYGKDVNVVHVERLSNQDARNEVSAA